MDQHGISDESHDITGCGFCQVKEVKSVFESVPAASSAEFSATKAVFALAAMWQHTASEWHVLRILNRLWPKAA